jgi:hypothetical protein
MSGTFEVDVGSGSKQSIVAKRVVHVRLANNLEANSGYRCAVVFVSGAEIVSVDTLGHVKHLLADALAPSLAPLDPNERAELERLRALINTPHTADFFTAVELEAAHQVEKHGARHDAGKEPSDWFWLLGYLSGKALAAFVRGDREKGLHHIISSAAALLNWHRNVTGVNTSMRPGIDTPVNKP